MVCSYQIWIAIDKYYQYQTVVSVQIRHMTNITFPAVTICNLNPIRASWLKENFSAALLEEMGRLNHVTFSIKQNKWYRSLGLSAFFFANAITSLVVGRGRGKWLKEWISVKMKKYQKGLCCPAYAEFNSCQWEKLIFLNMLVCFDGKLILVWMSILWTHVPSVCFPNSDEGTIDGLASGCFWWEHYHWSHKGMPLLESYVRRVF